MPDKQTKILRLRAKIRRLTDRRLTAQMLLNHDICEHLTGYINHYVAELKRLRGETNA